MNDPGEILLYQTEDGASRLDVRLVNETVWLSAGQIAELFQRDESVILKHIKNVFAERELNPGATVVKLATVRSRSTFNRSSSKPGDWKTKPVPRIRMPRTACAMTWTISCLNCRAGAASPSHWNRWIR
jgi:hypothetical protein